MMKIFRSKGGQTMWGRGRMLTESEREKIKENKHKEREYKGYVCSAISRMTPKPSTKRMKCYDK